MSWAYNKRPTHSIKFHIGYQLVLANVLCFMNVSLDRDYSLTLFGTGQVLYPINWEFEIIKKMIWKYYNINVY